MRNLILIHGALGHAKHFDALCDLLKDAYQLHVIELPAHGQNQEHVDFSIPGFSNYVAEYIQQHHLEAAGIFGYSMGGYIALHLAHQHPELVSKVMTLATKFDWNAQDTQQQVAMLNPDKMLEKVPQYVESLKAQHPATDWRQLLNKTAELMMQISQQAYLNDEVFQQLNLPVRIGRGDHDKMVSLQETAAVYEKLPQGSLYILPDTPHPIEKISVELMAPQIRNFF
ncbi:MAG: alpha/beta fold hydrolase [Chitinophagaceae bacterium]|nr:alpha/beta fold hydrolase [Chitinophagaceae bacterium]